MKKQKKYKVNISQVWSEEVTVIAENAFEAKQKAWNDWKAKKANYKLYADEISK